MDDPNKPYSVSVFGSHPDEDNDDCWTGEDYATKDEALAAFNSEEPWIIDRDNAFIMIDGPDINETRPNPHFVAKAKRPDSGSWQREIAMQSGMAFGCDGYNDAMGWGDDHE